MARKRYPRTWRHTEIDFNQHMLLLLLAAGFSHAQITDRLNLRPDKLTQKLTDLRAIYKAHNNRMLITLAYLDDQINFEQVLPYVISLLNGPYGQQIDE